MRQLWSANLSRPIHKFLDKIRDWRTPEPEFTVFAGTAATVCTTSNACAICETCNGLLLKIYGKFVDSTAGDVVQLVKTLPGLPSHKDR